MQRTRLTCSCLSLWLLINEIGPVSCYMWQVRRPSWLFASLFNIWHLTLPCTLWHIKYSCLSFLWHMTSYMWQVRRPSQRALSLCDMGLWHCYVTWRSENDHWSVPACLWHETFDTDMWHMRSEDDHWPAPACLWHTSWTCPPSAIDTSLQDSGTLAWVCR